MRGQAPKLGPRRLAADAERSQDGPAALQSPAAVPKLSYSLRKLQLWIKTQERGG